MYPTRIATSLDKRLASSEEVMAAYLSGFPGLFLPNAPILKQMLREQRLGKIA